MTEQEAIEVFRKAEIMLLSGSLVELQIATETAIKALEEIQQYRAIGTVEECREAAEKQRAKKPILDVIYHQQYYCPNCQDFIVRKNEPKPRYCICGQKLDWSEEE